MKKWWKLLFIGMMVVLGMAIYYQTVNDKTIAVAVHKSKSLQRAVEGSVDLRKFFFIQAPPYAGSDAHVDQSDDSIAVITEDQTKKLGILWSKKQIDLDMPFTLESKLYFNSKNNTPADGMAIVLQNDPAQINAYGTNGSGLGYSGGDTGTYYIKNAVALEFDPFTNYSADTYLKKPHMAWRIPSAKFQGGDDHKGVQFYDFAAINNKWLPLEYKWQPDSNLKSGTLQATWNGLTTTYKIADYPTHFKGRKAFFGFTGATGWESVKQAIQFTDFRNPGPALIVKKSVFDASGQAIDKQDVAEGDTLHYAIEAANNNGMDETAGATFIDTIPALTTYVPGSARYLVKDSAGIIKKQVKLDDASIFKDGKLEYSEQDGIQAKTKGELDFAVKVKSQSGGQTIKNSATVFDFMGLGRLTDEVTNPVALAKIGPVTQTVADVTDKGLPDEKEINASRIGDQIRYTFKTKIEGDSKAVLPGIDLLTEENATVHKDAGGQLDANSLNDYPKEYRLNDGNWQPLPPQADMKDGGVHLTILPTDGVTIHGGDVVEMRYSKKVTAIPPFNHYFYNEGVFNIGLSAADLGMSVKSNTTRFKQGLGKVIFRYIDRRNQQAIGDREITVTGPIGQKISELTTAETNGHQDPNKIRPAYIAGYVPVDYTDQSDLTTAQFSKIQDIDPVIDGQEMVYTFRYEKSRLEMQAPAEMSFGTVSNTPIDRVYYLPSQKVGNTKTPYDIKVADYWGVNSWHLSVQQAKQFTGINPEGQLKTLDDARLSFDYGIFTTLQSSGNTAKDDVETHDKFTLIPGGAATELITYHKKGHYLGPQQDNTGNMQYDLPGYSVYRYQFGDQQTMDYSIGLRVPGTTKRDKIQYKTTLKWNLTVAP
ncbi:WxL domain-containing protein [Latilactobacillus sakei]